VINKQGVAATHFTPPHSVFSGSTPG